MNISTELRSAKRKKDSELQGDANVKAVLLLQNSDAQEDLAIAQMLGQNSIVRAVDDNARKIELEKLDGKYAGNVFEIGQIKDLARRYNLRFLNARHYCAGMPVETIAKLKEFGKETNTTVLGNQYNYFILAPEKCFKLDMVKKVRRDPDPALFYKIDDNHYRMVHQWGADFTPWNRIQGLLWESRRSRFWTTTIPVLALLVVIMLCSHTDWVSILSLVLFFLWPMYRAVVSWNDESNLWDEDFHKEKWNSTTRLFS